MAYFDGIKVGDRIYNIRTGWHVVSEIQHSEMYAIQLNDTTPRSCTMDGFESTTDRNQTWFWDEVKITAPPRPRPNLKIDDPIIVWDDPEEKYNRYFAGWTSSGRIKTFINGHTSWSSDAGASCLFWDDYEIPIKD